MKPLKITGFTGMNNILSEGGFEGHQDGSMTAIPRVILNADVTEEARLKKRTGYRLLVNLPNAHSVWSSKNVMMAVSEGRIYRIYPDGSKVNLSAISGPYEAKMFYTRDGNLVYISSQYWMGILNIDDNTIKQWGLALPEQPVLAVESGNGSLEPGRYQVCYTNVVDGALSGNGIIAEVIVTEANSRILLLNKPTGVAAWSTDPDGSVFYRVAYDNSWFADIETSEPLPTLFCYPPLPMSYIRIAFGRMWGVIDDRLVYSEPYTYDLYRNVNMFQFRSNIKMLAFVNNGIYVGLDDETIFLTGTEPSGMKETSILGGVARNILAYCNNVPNMGDNIPVWVAKDGLVAGSHDGQLAKITHSKVQFPAGEEGAAVARMHNGKEQYIASFKQVQPQGSGVGFGDSATCEVVRNGKIITT